MFPVFYSPSRQNLPQRPDDVASFCASYFTNAKSAAAAPPAPVSISEPAPAQSFGAFGPWDAVIARGKEVLSKYPENRGVKYLLELEADGTIAKL